MKDHKTTRKIVQIPLNKQLVETLEIKGERQGLQILVVWELLQKKEHRRGIQNYRKDATDTKKASLRPEKEGEIQWLLFSSSLILQPPHSVCLWQNSARYQLTKEAGKFSCDDTEQSRDRTRSRPKGKQVIHLNTQ